MTDMLLPSLPESGSAASLDWEELLDFCRRLLCLPSLSGQEDAVAQLTAQKMQALGYDRVWVDEWGSVIGEVQGEGPGPTILFDAHMDVVPITDPDAWTHAPFGAEVEGGRLWGRGSADTKGALAAVILAAGKLARRDFNGRAVVVASVCEENLTGAAIGPLLDRYRPGRYVTGEPTNLQLGIAQKGRISLMAKAHGRSAHTSRPELGENAVYKMITAVERIRSVVRPQDPFLGSGVMELTELVSDPLPGTAFVPHGCRARWIGRLLPGETAESVLADWHLLLSDLEGVEIGLAPMLQVCYTGQELRMDDYIPGWRNPQSDPWLNQLQEKFLKCGLPAQTFGAPCGTNASAAAGLRAIPSLIYGPGSLEQAHTVDEWVSLVELWAAYLGYKAILARQ